MRPGDALLDRFLLRARLPPRADHVDVVNAIARIPYARTIGTSTQAVVNEWRGTCSSKHYLLAELLAQGWPRLEARVVHRAYRLEKRDAERLFGERVATAVPAEGVWDVHTWLAVRVGRHGPHPLAASEGWVPVDATFALGLPWDGVHAMDLYCGTGIDIVVPPNKDAREIKRDLVARYCDEAAREPFIAALARETEARQGSDRST